MTWSAKLAPWPSVANAGRAVDFYKSAVAAAVATRAADSSLLARGARTTWRCSASTPVEVQRVTRRQQAIRPLRNPA